MNLQNLYLLYDYNHWANDRILSAAAGLSTEQFIAPAGHSYGGLRGTLVHLYDAEYSWRMMCQHGKDTPEIFEDEFPTLDALTVRWRDEEAAMRAYLGGLNDGDLLGIVRYTVEDGQRERVLWHCLWHVVNHGTQHRAEAAAILTGYGASPGDVDFTLFLNERG